MIAGRAEPEFRYEIKYGTSMTALPEVLAWVRTHPAGFRVAYAPRLVNSVYFDTAHWSDLSANLSGAAARSKVRLRWYGRDVGTCDGRLELKEKRGELGRKHAAPIGAPLVLRSRPWAVIVRDLRTRALGDLLPVLDRHDRATMLGRYERRYFVSADGAVRLTIDTDIRAYDQTGAGVPNLTHAGPRQDMLVVELKCDADRRRHLADIATLLPLRRVAHSKYAHGVLARVA